MSQNLTWSLLFHLRIIRLNEINHVAVLDMGI